MLPVILNIKAKSYSGLLFKKTGQLKKKKTFGILVPFFPPDSQFNFSNMRKVLDHRL